MVSKMNEYGSYIFLDYDGPMRCTGEIFTNEGFNKTSVKLLKRLCKDHNAGLVIIATARKHKTLDQVRSEFVENTGWKSPPIVGATKDLGFRNTEVVAFYTEHCDNKPYVIIDDEWTYPPYQPLVPCFLYTPIGIVEYEVADKILRGKVNPDSFELLRMLRWR